MINLTFPDWHVYMFAVIGWMVFFHAVWYIRGIWDTLYDGHPTEVLLVVLYVLFAPFYEPLQVLFLGLKELGRRKR